MKCPVCKFDDIANSGEKKYFYALSRGFLAAKIYKDSDGLVRFAKKANETDKDWYDFNFIICPSCGSVRAQEITEYPYVVEK